MEIEKKRITVVFGSRADAGILSPVFTGLRDLTDYVSDILAVDGDSKLLDVLSQQALEASKVIKFDVSDGEPLSIARAIGRITAEAGDCLNDLKPDLLFVLGDRYEIFAVVSAATALGIPIAHLCGGDVTEGANDDMYRHAISKMSHLHFPSNEEASKRLCQMGERAETVHVIGNPSLDLMLAKEALEPEQFFDRVGLSKRTRNILVTYHPETLSDLSPSQQIEPLIEFLSELDDDHSVLITAANLDAGGHEINKHLSYVAKSREAINFYPNLGAELYHSALVNMDVMVGNSSSGLYEAPSFNCATVNIGRRQTGRLKASSVIDCENNVESIKRALEHAYAINWEEVQNPYGDGQAVKRLLDVVNQINTTEQLQSLKVKRFNDLDPHQP